MPSEYSHIRPMLESDLHQVLAIEKQAFSHPWSLKLYQDALTSYECWVLEVAGKHVGHGVISKVVDEAHLLNIAVDVEQQGQGFGYQLLDFLMQRSHERGCVDCFLELRASNTAAYKLYEHYGFNEIGRRKNYYPAAHGQEDAIIMVCPLG